jgi:hypothetical protein
MGLFEEHPWMLIPLVIVITEAWSGFKRLLERKLSRESLSPQINADER